MSHRKKLLYLLIAIAAVGLLVVLLRPAAVPATITQVDSGRFVEYVEDEGVTRLRHTYTVAAPIAAFLRRPELEPGDQVARGDPVFTLEPLPAPGMDTRSREQTREQVAAARARLEQARADLELRATQTRLAERELERNRELHARELISTEEIERRQAIAEASRSALTAAEHAVEMARFELEAARATLEIMDGTRSGDDLPLLPVPAPISGTITHRHRCCEGPVQSGEPVMEIGDLDALEVQVDLLSMDAVRLAPGMRVEIDRWGGEAVLDGEVRRIEPAGFRRVSALGVDEQRVPVRVRLLTPRNERSSLGAEFRVEARFVLWEGDDVLQLPTSALVRNDEGWQVFVVEDGRARPRDVSIGRRSGLRTQVLDGLTAGEAVIDYPGDRISAGVRVRAD